jgi:PatG Domain
MEQNELIAPHANRLVMPTNALANQNPFANNSITKITPQVGGAGCGCVVGAEGGGEPGGPVAFVFAIGKIEMRFPSLGVEKEFAQATGRAETAGLTDQQASANVLSRPENRYLARQVCWVMTIEGLETYILLPRDPDGLNLLLAAVRPAEDPRDIDVVIGLRGPVAPAELCNGLILPMVVFDQVYSFDRDALINAIPPPKAKLAAKDERQFRTAAGELYDKITQIADNAGATDEHRALNYLAVRYPAIYGLADRYGEDFSFTSVETAPSRLSGVRNIISVIFTFTNRKTDVSEKYFVRVDVTEEFPFLVSKLQPYYDH